jgi:hypothetical protein
MFFKTNIKSTEEIIDLILDSNRNTLLALDLKVSIGTMGLGLGALTAGEETHQTHKNDAPAPSLTENMAFSLNHFA